MKKLLSAVALGLALIVGGSAEAVTGGTGNGNGDIMKVQTKADWYKAGQESITLGSRSLGGGYKGLVYEVYDIWIDGSYAGRLGGIGKGIGVSTKLFPLKRNKIHTFRIKYNQQATAEFYRKSTGRNLKNSRSHYWNVVSTHKVANYW